jgi:hypothetical protein
MAKQRQKQKQMQRRRRISPAEIIFSPFIMIENIIEAAAAETVLRVIG